MKLFYVKDNIERLGKSMVIGCMTATIAFQLNYQTIYYRITERGRTEISSKLYYSYNDPSNKEIAAFIKILEYDSFLIGFWLILGFALGLSILKLGNK